MIGLSDDCAPGAALFDSPFFYVGTVDTTPPPRVDFLTFNPAVPLSLIPGIGPVLAGWFASLNFEICLGGLSVRSGGYNTGITASLGSSC